MDISRLKKDDLRVWVPLFEGVEVLCRYIPQTEFDKILAESKEIKFHPKSHQKQEVQDPKAFRSALARAVVQDWRGLKDGAADFPCTPENIDYLMEELTDFRTLVTGVPLSLEKMIEVEKAALEKNS